MELKRGESLAYGQDKDYEEPVCQENWEPRKRNPELSDDGFSGLDILALLVSIYGSTDVFVNEYRVQLAEVASSAPRFCRSGILLFFRTLVFYHRNYYSRI